MRGCPKLRGGSTVQLFETSGQLDFRVSSSSGSDIGDRYDIEASGGAKSEVGGDVGVREAMMKMGISRDQDVGGPERPKLPQTG